MSNSTHANENADIKENFYKVKNVFTILIEEASYLIDDKAYQMCEGKSQKDQFLIMIDSIRKSLNIESMDDVELLVNTFYEFGPKKRQRLQEEEQKRLAMKEDQ
jgi:dynein regulatry complex protein 1